MDSTMKNITFILAAFAVSFLIALFLYLGLLNILIAVCKIYLGILLRIRKLLLKAGTRRAEEEQDEQ